MPQNAFFLRTRNLLINKKNTTQRHFLFTLHPLSMVIFATATVLAFVLLHNSSFNFHCYTQREAMPTQKSARKWAATSRDFLRERVQSTFTLANQLHWIAQYTCMPGESYCRWLMSLLLYLCYVFEVLSNSLLCWKRVFIFHYTGRPLQVTLQDPRFHPTLSTVLVILTFLYVFSMNVFQVLK